MRDERKIWLTIAVIAMLIITGMAYTMLNPQNPDEENLSLDVKMSKSEYVGFENISVTIALKNCGNLPVEVEDMDTKYANLELYLTIPDSTVLEFETPQVKCPPDEITLKPGEKIVRTVMLNPNPRYSTGFRTAGAEIGYYDFSQPGEHSLYAVYDYHNETGWNYIQSNEVRFTILSDTGAEKLSLSLNTDKTEYESNENITATARLKNIDTTAVEVDDMNTVYMNLRLHLVLPNSTTLEYDGPVVYCLPNKITLEPGEEMVRSVPLSPTGFSGFRNNSAGITSYYDFSQKGEYRVSATYTFGWGNCSYDIQSNEAVFKIL